MCIWIAVLLTKYTRQSFKEAAYVKTIPQLL
jgi:hypothetical protein